MNIDSSVEAISAAAGAAVVVGEASRRYWTRREIRQQAAFRRAVQQIVDEAIGPVIERLNSQDVQIERLRRTVVNGKG